MKKIIKVTAVVPSAGRGKRFKLEEKKPFANLNKRPILSYVLKTLQSSSLIHDIILVMRKSQIELAKRFIERHGFTKVRHVVEGGATRTESVAKGLRYVDKDVSLVLIHDGVRPFLTEGLIRRTVAAASKFGASVAAVPVKATIKVSKKDFFVKDTPERRDLWEVQTPQVFRKDLIVRAYKNLRRNMSFTDDASLIENLGKTVKMVKGDYRNIKITTAEDIKIAKVLLKSRE